MHGKGFREWENRKVLKESRKLGREREVGNSAECFGVGKRARLKGLGNGKGMAEV